MVLNDFKKVLKGSVNRKLCIEEYTNFYEKLFFNDKLKLHYEHVHYPLKLTWKTEMVFFGNQSWRMRDLSKVQKIYTNPILFLLNIMCKYDQHHFYSNHLCGILHGIIYNENQKLYQNGWKTNY